MPERSHMKAGWLREVRDSSGQLRYLRGRLGAFEIRAYPNHGPGEPDYTLTLGLRPQTEASAEEAPR